MFNKILLDFASEEAHKQYKSCAVFYSNVKICLLFLPQAIVIIWKLG